MQVALTKGQIKLVFLCIQ